MKKILIIIGVLAVIAGGAYVALSKKSGPVAVVAPTHAEDREVHVSVYYQGKAFLPFVEGFQEGLSEYFSPEKNTHIKVSYKVTELVGDTQDLLDQEVKKLADEEKPDMILAVGPQLMSAAKKATVESQTPVLFGYGGNPNDGKFVKSMQSSENNMVGITWRAYELSGKRLEILKRIDPRITKVLVYSKKGSAALKSSTDYVNESAKAAGLTITIRDVDTTQEFEADLAKFDKKQFDAVSYLNDPFFVKNNGIFQKAIAEKKIPSVFHEALFARGGALASFGAEYRPAGLQLSRLAKKIIAEGQKPSEIPSEAATQLNLTLNLDTAKKFGITFSEDLLAVANEVIPVSE